MHSLAPVVWQIRMANNKPNHYNQWFGSVLMARFGLRTESNRLIRNHQEPVRFGFPPFNQVACKVRILTSKNYDKLLIVC